MSEAVKAPPAIKVDRVIQMTKTYTAHGKVNDRSFTATIRIKDDEFNITEGPVDFQDEVEATVRANVEERKRDGRLV